MREFWQPGRPLRALCAGDLFISSDLLADALRIALGPDSGDLVVTRLDSQWPDQPFAAHPGLRESAGDPAEVALAAADAEVLLTHLAPVTSQVLAAAGRLRLVAVTRGGPVNVDLAAADRADVPVAYLPGRNLGAVAEFVVGSTIALMRNVSTSSSALAQGRWDGSWFRYDRCGPELRACTVGLIGLGAVGARVAQLFSAFGCTVLAHDPYADPQQAASLGVRLVPLPELLSGSDVVSLHARLTDDTRGMVDAAVLGAMRPGSYLVNTARGELVVQQALHDALREGHLAGAALDVFDPEPPDPDDPLLRRPDVLATPHLAGSSRQVAQESANRVAETVVGYLREGRLEHRAGSGG